VSLEVIVFVLDLILLVLLLIEFLEGAAFKELDAFESSPPPGILLSFSFGGWDESIVSQTLFQ
jgi:hypothetical protein